MGVILKLISVVLAFLSVFGGGNGGTVMYEPAEPYLMLSAHRQYGHDAHHCQRRKITGVDRPMMLLSAQIL